MTLVDVIAERLGSEVAALTGRVEYVADLAALVSEGALPQNEVAAYVVPLGIDDRGGDSAAGMYTQSIVESIGVILCVKALGDPKARKAVPRIDALSDAVIEALAGWAPNNVVGVFRLSRGRIVSVSKGLMIYQLDFALTDQLRIAR